MDRSDLAVAGEEGEKRGTLYRRWKLFPPSLDAARREKRKKRGGGKEFHSAVGEKKLVRRGVFTRKEEGKYLPY